MAKKSELLWVLADYQSNRVDPPARIRDNPELCEAEMMTREEVEEFIKDSIATLRILGDKNSPHYSEVADLFGADIAALVACGQLEDDDYEALTDESNLRF